MIPEVLPNIDNIPCTFLASCLVVATDLIGKQFGYNTTDRNRQDPFQGQTAGISRFSEVAQSVPGRPPSGLFLQDRIRFSSEQAISASANPGQCRKHPISGNFRQFFDLGRPIGALRLFRNCYGHRLSLGSTGVQVQIPVGQQCSPARALQSIRMTGKGTGGRADYPHTLSSSTSPSQSLSMPSQLSSLAPSMGSQA